MLAALSLTCALFVSVSALCTRSTSCPCGSSSKNYTLCVDYVPIKTDPCVRWNQCQTCQEGISSCLTCPPGYYGPTCSEVTGLKLIRRKRQNSWSEQTFQIGQCPPISPPTSGYIRCQPRARRGRCRGKCKPGLNFEGETEAQIELECRGRQWHPRDAFPPCVVETTESDCPDPGTSRDLIRYPPARQFPGTFVEEESVAFACSDSDEVLDGPSEITCMSDGTWSAPMPRCVVPDPQPCPFPGVDPNGQVFVRSAAQGPLDTNQMFQPGTRLIYTCNEGYVRFGGSESLTCLPSGEWSSYYPDCTSLSTEPDPGVYCPDPGPISNGRAQSISRTRMKNGDVEYPLGGIVSYSCEIGYALHGSQELVCQDSGSWSGSLPSCVEVCGKSTLEASRRITHGIKTLAGEWPWVVSISVVSRNNYTNMICGGALIDRRTVLTAAHCLVSPNRYYVLHFGKFFRIVTLDDDDVEVRRSTRTISHPDFNPNTYDNDIALIRFAPTISYSEKILPICLPTAESTENNLVPQHKGYVTGWGITEDDVQASELMMAKLPVQSDATCTESYQRHGIDFQINPGMFCAGFPEGRMSTCRGDSGSPFVFYNELLKRYTVEGCVSFSVKGSCGREGRYTVFTKVAHYMPWIRRNW